METAPAGTSPQPPARVRRRSFAKTLDEKPRNRLGEDGKIAGGDHPRDLTVINLRPAAARGRREDHDQIARPQPLREPRAEIHKRGGIKTCLDLGERAEREPQRPVPAGEPDGHIAAMSVRHGQIAVKVSAPALSSARSNVTSP